MAACRSSSVAHRTCIPPPVRPRQGRTPKPSVGWRAWRSGAHPALCGGASVSAAHWPHAALVLPSSAPCPHAQVVAGSLPHSSWIHAETIVSHKDATKRILAHPHQACPPTTPRGPRHLCMLIRQPTPTSRRRTEFQVPHSAGPPSLALDAYVQAGSDSGHWCTNPCRGLAALLRGHAHYSWFCHGTCRTLNRLVDPMLCLRHCGFHYDAARVTQAISASTHAVQRCASDRWHSHLPALATQVSPAHLKPAQCHEGKCAPI